MTSQGHPYAIFRRALERRNLPSAWGFCAEASVDLEAGTLVLHLLAAIGGGESVPAARALRELIASYDTSLAEPLRRWEMEQAADR